MTSSNVLLFPGRAYDTTNFVVLGIQTVRQVTQGGGQNPPPPALPDSEKPGLFRVKAGGGGGGLRGLDHQIHIYIYIYICI